jgi:aminoglycoside phosphotransferase (APT) family kinase protein
MLTISEVIPYLCQRGILTGRSVVDGDVRVFDFSRRNQNYKIRSLRGESYFLKQGIERDGFSSVQREHQVYALLADRPIPLPFIPRLIDYDDETDVLVTEFVSGADDLRRIEANRSTALVQAAGRLGRVLALLHHQIPVGEAQRRIGEGQPGVLTAQRPGSALLRDFSAASIDLVRLIQQEVNLVQHLAELESGWRVNAIIHHDVRLENVLWMPATRTVTLVDWETAAVGDSDWDLGAAIGDYLGLWLLSIPARSDRPPDQSLHLARRTLPSVQPAIVALFDTYCRVTSSSSSSRLDRAERVTRYAGLKLVQSSIEQVQVTPTWTMTALCCLQVGANMLARPRQASAVLLGLDTSG